MKDCTGATRMKLRFEYVLTRFGCPKVLMSEFVTHFLNETICWKILGGGGESVFLSN